MTNFSYDFVWFRSLAIFHFIYIYILLIDTARVKSLNVNVKAMAYKLRAAYLNDYF